MKFIVRKFALSAAVAFSFTIGAMVSAELSACHQESNPCDQGEVCCEDCDCCIVEGDEV